MAKAQAEKLELGKVASKAIDGLGTKIGEDTVIRLLQAAATKIGTPIPLDGVMTESVAGQLVSCDQERLFSAFCDMVAARMRAVSEHRKEYRDMASWLTQAEAAG